MRNLAALVEGAFERAEGRSSQVASHLRESLQGAFADIGRTLGETQQRADVTADAMRSALLGASEEASRAVDATMNNAEQRARGLSERIRSGVEGSLTDVERMLADATSRSDSAAAHLREQLRKSVDEAVGRFSGATDEIRRSAEQIREELDSTRAELRRGAFDLPEEAKENAAAMRRAVSEQIKALQDLSQLVGRSAQALEVSQPAPVRAAAPQAEPAPRAQPAAALPAQPAPAIRGGNETDLRGSLNFDRPSTPARPAEPAARGQEGGWISDLLRGASRENASDAASRAPTSRPAEQAGVRGGGDSRNPRHMVESLNSLSVDIARAIDHDASVDLWRRYQRGERDVFTRRLYTLKGQQTFDEIKRKYEREPEFRTAVDRYIGDFEKLLADVARTDRDKSVTQSYLTSDTGKVYTMLAHAAGRFS